MNGNRACVAEDLTATWQAGSSTATAAGFLVSSDVRA